MPKQKQTTEHQFPTAITLLPGMENVQVIQVSPQIIKENSYTPSKKK